MQILNMNTRYKYFVTQFAKKNRSNNSSYWKSKIQIQIFLSFTNINTIFGLLSSSQSHMHSHENRQVVGFYLPGYFLFIMFSDRLGNIVVTRECQLLTVKHHQCNVYLCNNNWPCKIHIYSLGEGGVGETQTTTRMKDFHGTCLCVYVKRIITKQYYQHKDRCWWLWRI